MSHLKAKLLWKNVLNDNPYDEASEVEMHQKWQDSDMQAQGKIGERIHPKFHELLRNKNTAKEQWNAIKDIAESLSANSMIRARREFSYLELEEDGDVYEHLAKLEKCKRLLQESDAPVGAGEMILRVLDSLPSSWKSYLDGLRSNPNLLKNYEDF